MQAARLAVARTGDFELSHDAKQAIDEHECKPKSTQYGAEKKRTTCGALFAVSGCGIFVMYDELFGSESLTQVRVAAETP